MLKWSVGVATVVMLSGISGVVKSGSAQTPGQGATTCPVSKPVLAEAPADPNADLSGQGLWYINANRSIWAVHGRWIAGVLGNKVLWIRPAGSDFTVSGRRLSAGDVGGLRADLPCCYRTGFQASRLYFSTPGCWEVTAKAGPSEFTFVTEVF